MFSLAHGGGMFVLSKNKITNINQLIKSLTKPKILQYHLQIHFFLIYFLLFLFLFSNNNIKNIFCKVTTCVCLGVQRHTVFEFAAMRTVLNKFISNKMLSHVVLLLVANQGAVKLLKLLFNIYFGSFVSPCIDIL